MNPLLEQTKNEIFQKADKRLHPVIQELVAQGKSNMYSEKMRDTLIEELGNGQDPEMIGEAVAKLTGLVFNQTKKTAPMEALIPAAFLLLMEGLQFIEDSGAIKVDEKSLASYSLAAASNVAQLFGVTPDKLQGMVDKSGSAAPTGGPSPTGTPAPTGIINQAQGAM